MGRRLAARDRAPQPPPGAPRSGATGAGSPPDPDPHDAPRPGAPPRARDDVSRTAGGGPEPRADGAVGRPPGAGVGLPVGVVYQDTPGGSSAIGYAADLA